MGSPRTREPFEHSVQRLHNDFDYVFNVFLLFLKEYQTNIILSPRKTKFVEHTVQLLRNDFDYIFNAFLGGGLRVLVGGKGYDEEEDNHDDEDRVVMRAVVVFIVAASSSL